MRQARYQLPIRELRTPSPEKEMSILIQIRTYNVTYAFGTTNDFLYIWRGEQRCLTIRRQTEHNKEECPKKLCGRLSKRLSVFILIFIQTQCREKKVRTGTSTNAQSVYQFQTYEASCRRNLVQKDLEVPMEERRCERICVSGGSASFWFEGL